jgi:hypothetical protein
MIQSIHSNYTRETLRPFPRNSKYLVSDKGRIFSKSSKRFISGRPDRKGYYRVGMILGGKIKEIYIHRMVCETFRGPMPEGCDQINHIDCNINNNNVSNLEWCNSSRNAKHAYDNGLNIPQRGTRHSRSKLTEDQAEEIRVKHKNKQGSYRKLATQYKVHHSIIWRIVNNRAY